MKFIREMFSDGDVASWGRVGSFISLVAVIAWATMIVMKTNALPDMKGPSLFISAMYGISKMSDMIESLKKPEGKSDGE